MTQAASRGPRRGHGFTPAESISYICTAEAEEEVFPETLLALTYFVHFFSFFFPLLYESKQIKGY